MASPTIASTSAAGAVLANAVGGSSKSSRRRRGPAFLPSEHDELPKDVAFMVSVFMKWDESGSKISWLLIFV
jgi:division protein 1